MLPFQANEVVRYSKEGFAMPLFEVTKTLVDIGAAILGSAEKVKGLKRDALVRTATVLGEIATCMDAIVQHAESKDWPSVEGRCEELRMYLRNFDTLNLGLALSEEKTLLIKKLNAGLYARHALLLANELKMPHDNGAPIDDLRRAAGSFRGASTLLRATD
jgi:hypothetical protein